MILKAKWRVLATASLFFLIAFGIRAIGIHWGIPSQNYQHAAFVADEPGVLYASLILNEGAYLTILLQNYPFFYYLSFLIFKIYYGLGLLTGLFSSWSDFQLQYYQDISQFILVGRYFSVFLASATVAATYLIGRSLFRNVVGFIAAVFMLFSFGHVVESQTFRLDPFLPLLFLVSFYLIVRLSKAPANRLRPYVLTGLVLAITFATKVTAWALLIPFLMVPFVHKGKLTLRPQRLRPFLFSLTILAGTYLALTAPALFELNDITSEILSSRLDKSGEFGNPAHISPYAHSLIWHLSRTLPQQLGIMVYLPAILGLVLIPLKRQNRVKGILLIVTLAAYLLPIGYATRTTWRDMLPMLPLLAISAAFALSTLFSYGWPKPDQVDRRRQRHLALAAVVIGLLIVPMHNTYRHKYLLLQPDTRDLAKSWIEANIEQGTNLAVESYGPGILDEKYRQEIENTLQNHDVSRIAPHLASPVYNVFLLDWDLIESKDRLQPERLIPYLESNDIQYVVTSSGYYARFYNNAIDQHYPERAISGRAFHDAIESHLQLVKQFTPNWDNRPGPVIKVYRVPDTLEPLPIQAGNFDPFPGMERPASAVGYYEFSPR